MSENLKLKNMCFVIHPGHPNAKTVKRDVVCYKTLTADRVSVMQGFTYKIGKRYALPEPFPNIRTFPTILWNGNSDKNNLRSTRQCRAINRDNEIHVGYHSYSSKKMLRERVRRTGYVPFRCTIPKGSTYYFNPDRHEYVSNGMKIVSQMKDFKR